MKKFIFEKSFWRKHIESARYEKKLWNCAQKLRNYERPLTARTNACAKTDVSTPAANPAAQASRGGGSAICDAHVHLSWNVRYRTFLWFFSQMTKLYKARSHLYRRQILQENIRWKALDEIYKIYMPLHRSDLNISEIFRQFFSHFLAKICKNSLFLNSFHWFLLRFWWNFVGISPII